MGGLGRRIPRLSWRTIRADAITRRGAIVQVIAEQQGYRFEVRSNFRLRYQSERFGTIGEAKAAAERYVHDRRL